MVHDLAPLVGPEWFARSMRLYRRVVTTAARRAEAVLTVSQVVAGELAGIGVDPERITVVRPAVDPSFAPAADRAVQAVRKRYGLIEPYLLFVGWGDPRKDLATALAAHRRAVERIDHRLVLVGGRHPVFAPVDVPTDPTVVVADYVNDEELRALLTGANALLYPSRYEGFGLPPLEAWACGTPALLADIPVLRESTAGRGVYLPVGDVDAWADAITDVLTDPPAAPEPPARTWDDAAAELLPVLAGISGGPDRP